MVVPSSFLPGVNRPTLASAGYFVWYFFNDCIEASNRDIKKRVPDIRIGGIQITLEVSVETQAEG